MVETLYEMLDSDPSVNKKELLLVVAGVYFSVLLHQTNNFLPYCTKQIKKLRGEITSSLVWLQTSWIEYIRSLMNSSSTVYYLHCTRSQDKFSIYIYDRLIKENQNI